MLCLLKSNKNIWASMGENLLWGFANNKGTDKPWHLHSLISAFVIGLMLLSIGKYYIWTCYQQNFIFLAILCKCTVWFESQSLYENPEDRLSNKAHVF